MANVLKFTLSLLCFLLFVSCQSQNETQYQKINKETLVKKGIGKDVQLIDVRTAGEYKNGHIGDAINMNVNDPAFQTQVLTLDRSKPVYLYCKKGGRSSRASEILKTLGFKAVYDYAGGYDDWVQSE